LGEEHEYAVEAFVKVWVSLGFEKLEAEVSDSLALARSNTSIAMYVQVKTGDSSSCTSLSI
jgi:hypothetical protein